MLEARERVEVETVHFTKRQTQLRNLIDHDAKLHTFMQRKLQEVILLEDDDSSKNKSIIFHRETCKIPAHQKIAS